MEIVKDSDLYTRNKLVFTRDLQNNRDGDEEIMDPSLLLKDVADEETKEKLGKLIEATNELSNKKDSSTAIKHTKSIRENLTHLKEIAKRNDAKEAEKLRNSQLKGTGMSVIATPSSNANPFGNLQSKDKVVKFNTESDVPPPSKSQRQQMSQVLAKTQVKDNKKKQTKLSDITSFFSMIRSLSILNDEKMRKDKPVSKPLLSKRKISDLPIDNSSSADSKQPNTHYSSLVSQGFSSSSSNNNGIVSLNTSGKQLDIRKFCERKNSQPTKQHATTHVTQQLNSIDSNTSNNLNSLNKTLQILEATRKKILHDKQQSRLISQNQEIPSYLSFGDTPSSPLNIDILTKSKSTCKNNKKQKKTNLSSTIENLDDEEHEVHDLSAMREEDEQEALLEDNEYQYDDFCVEDSDSDAKFIPSAELFDEDDEEEYDETTFKTYPRRKLYTESDKEEDEEVDSENEDAFSDVSVEDLDSLIEENKTILDDNLDSNEEDLSISDDIIEESPIINRKKEVIMIDE